MPEYRHLCDTFIERTNVSPDDPFAILLRRGETRVLTNRWLLARAGIIGHHLRDAGAASGGVIVIVLEHGADLYSSFVGCMMAGLVPSFLPPLTHKQDPSVFRRSMAALFARITPAAVVTSDASRQNIPDGDWPILVTDDIADIEPVDHRVMLPGGETAFLQHSSGTTGLKKGVMLSHAAVIDQITRYADATAIAPGDVIASWLPLYHDMGLITGFLLPLLLGNVVVSLDALEWVARPTMLLDAMQRYRAAFVWLPNFAFHHLLRAAGGQPRWDLSTVKAIINCSEPCRTDTFDRFADCFTTMGIDRSKLSVCYALAENVFAVTRTPLGQVARGGKTDATRGFLSSGQPIAGAEIEIRDPAGERVPAGVLGEIHIRSTTLFDGYFRDPERTQERLRDGWFGTRDLGCVEDGELFIPGRVDDLLIVNGRNLFAHEIESVLSGVTGIVPGRVLACTEHDPALGASRLLIHCEIDMDQSDAESLDGEIRKIVLAETGIFPAAVRFLPRGFLVKSSSGKLARAESIAKFARSRRS
jgi:acyl-CoA synthetase (AMP-forming)/AMP-acid ligase II